MEQQAIRVLITDDYADAADSLGALLRDSGYDVSVAYSGQDAVRIAGQFQPHVVILDLMMPSMDGFETAAALKALACCNHTVYIAHSALTDGGLIARIKQAGFQHLLRKPADYAQFEEILCAIPTGPVS